MNRPELETLLEQHDRRGLCWVTISTEDLRELLKGAEQKPEPLVLGSFDPEAIAAAIRNWPIAPAAPAAPLDQASAWPFPHTD